MTAPLDPAAVAAAFHYDLPADLIARAPAPERSASRLLRCDGGGAVLGESAFAELPDLLRAGDLLVVNDSAVIPARLDCVRQASGGRVEVLLERPAGDGRWEVLARPARRLAHGETLALAAAPGLGVTLLERRGDGFLAAGRGADLAALARDHGRMPLPPYILKARRADGLPEDADADRERYQTVYAGAAGSVAAPTAGLHFDAPLLERLRDRGVGLARVRLDVGAGTFRNPDDRDLAEERLHAESFALDADAWRAVAAARAAGGRVIAVGTTSLRVLETVARLDLDAPGPDHRAWPADAEARPLFDGEAVREDDAWRVSGRTRLFLRPPARLRAAHGLITNFHLPGSSLLMLVACATGGEGWRGLYAAAVARGLRFYSYGDASLILPVADAEETP
ncbi:MAG TPA: S-adenosylmethionine:tRNA ribosyltransferase-isomerase [Candidatus Krumholzibacteria bacterium]|nr:S-adenosylmethionine:tRNA ribosyltransferase-isomerase [Candidatus Krumholzibacteria bacterium]HRX50302.1 S-adenosylmethionine:tRNA ribosyltransferase-isomerase [Candidatus Krumholzibacteria bacterium]